MANRINHLINAYRQLKQQAEDSVLATIVETFGSTYQKAGARMLITQQGKLIGLLGGGCFERDLIEQAQSVFETGEAKTVFYDMRSPDDVVWGLGLGCNGAVRILLQLLKAKYDFSPLNVIADAAEADIPSVLVSIYKSEHPGFPVGHSFFLLGSGNRQLLTTTPSPFMAPTLQTLLQQKSRVESHVINNQVIGAFYDPLQPPLRLLVLGAGADAIPLVQCAKSLGWRVSVVDHRPGHIKKERFPQADDLLHLMPQDLNNSLELNQFNALVLMTHNIEYDERYLKSIMYSDIPFIGLLGPSHRKDRLLQSLGSDATRISNRVFGPVGLDIGAETPDEIALSIMAGIHAELNGRSGRQLSLKAASDCHECIH
ncbi:XdhC family protein [Methylobacter sp. BlB1]|uniref:XdhC family protein n=1 Tax=Methylobacter sp. BlB1 TaxID=2785914 RepID=UPI001894DAC0|nr:XdhC/CoxI family protein [Methylobacter sp. BlB1]MBF6650634.1 XdhC family protein [Methylobacter sp. BlB1]